MQKFYIKETAIGKVISKPTDIYEEFQELAKADQESFWLVGLNTANKIILKECVFLGGINHSIVDVKIIFKRLLLKGCSSFLCIHNHPAGSLNPSPEDSRLTKRIKEVGMIIGISLLDHIIIGDGYYSYEENGVL